MADPFKPPGLESNGTIPDGLRHQLDEFRGQLWRAKIIEALAAGGIGLLASFLLVYGIDRVWQTPVIFRLVILLLGGSLSMVFAPYWLHRWLWKQRKQDQLARLIARRYPGLGDRLLGVLELQREGVNENGHSSRLLEAAMESVALEVERCNLDAALPIRKQRIWVVSVVALAGIAAMVVTWTPRAGLNALQRLLLPWSKTERYTFTRLANPPTSRVVAAGESFEITLRLDLGSEQHPTSAFGKIGTQPVVMSRLKSNAYRFVFPGQQEPRNVTFKVGDLRHEVRVIPIARPAVESALATITYPSYLNLGSKTTDLSTGTLNVVAGSQLNINLTINRPLGSAKFGPTQAKRSGGPPEDDEEFRSSSGLLEISSNMARTSPIDVGTVPFEIPFSWVDTHSLEGESGYHLLVAASKDIAPSCYLQGIDRQKVMLPEETLDFELSAEDDFGVKEAGIEWEGDSNRMTAETLARGSFDLLDGANEGQRFTRAVAFSPAAFGIGPQKIMLRGYCEDAYPKRRRVYSEPITLYVLTRDEHAQMLKGKFDRIVTEFEDLARREQELLDENQRLMRLDGKALQDAPSQKRLEGQEQAEAESKIRMEDLTERMESLMKDSTRNGEIPKATLQKIAESLKPMQELYQNDLPAVKNKIGDAQERSNTEEKTSTDVSRAVEEQTKAVEKMQDAIAKINEANRRFEAGTFVNRLKKAAGEQSALASALVDVFPSVLGVRMSKLDPADQRRLKQASMQQANTASDLRWLQEDLASYFGRTKGESFKQILDEMRSSRLDVGLEDIRSLLTINHAFMATENSRKWARQLDEWAKKLEGENDRSGNGVGDSRVSPEDEDFEFMLRVMKLVQQEQDLRGQTRVLEQARRTPPNSLNQTKKP
ncbi:MAG: hypothetical protein QE267_07060 [Akkermansiaceae bacterium]|nr:hypothetical protein [Akkermansiaceae bacterium]